MSEEEKEAIEYIKELIKPPLREEWDFAYKLDKRTAKQFKTLINYIDKLQKENEKLKEDKAVLSKEILADKTKIVLLKQENEELKRKTYKAYIDDKGKIQFVFDNFISKDKIRNKIKELEKTTTDELRYDFLMNRDEVKRAVIRILEELLN